MQMPKIQTLCDLIYVSIPHYDKPDCLLAKRNGSYHGISAGEVIATTESVASRLIELGIRKGDRVGILSENRPEWALTDLGILLTGAVVVPIYSTLPSKQVQYLIQDSEMKIIFASTPAQLQKILEVRDELPRLEHVVVFDPLEEMDAQAFPEFVAEGQQFLASHPEKVRKRSSRVRSEDVFTFIYTSGTTGYPKGAMLTHDNIISNIESILNFFPIHEKDCTLSFLPLSHVFERMAGYYTMLYAGCTIAYAEGIETISKNLMEVRPSFLMAVPRVFEKFHAKILESITRSTGLKRILVGWGLKVAHRKSERKAAGAPPSLLFQVQYLLADILVFRTIREKLGGRLRLIVSGGAALPPQIARFFHGIGLTILEGYGLTETGPVISCNRPEDFRFGTVGKPIPGVEVRIAEDGEILARGRNIMKGYYNKPEQTNEAISEEGWFHTGDVGEFDLNGFLKITDRKKDLIVTSAGKNIAPQFVENALKTSPYITQIVVVGNKRKFPSALVVPNTEQLKQFARKNQIPEDELYSNPKVLREIQQDLDRLSVNLASFERVKKIALLPNEFTIESGELTPSLKIKRNVVEKRYSHVIDSLYSETLAE